MPKEIKIGQNWSPKFGAKRSDGFAKIVRKLNSKCWEIQDSFNTRIINTEELLREYNFQKDNDE